MSTEIQEVDRDLYTIEVSVMSSAYRFEPFWENFREYYIGQGWDMNDTAYIDLALAEWSAVNDQEDPGSNYFYFRDQRDYVMFMLRWS